jgi:hypothetical protein
MKTTLAKLLCGLTCMALPSVTVGADAVPTAPDVFNRYFTAIGGRPTLEKIQSLVIKGVGQENQDTFQFEMTLKGPGLVLLVARNDRGLEV